MAGENSLCMRIYHRGPRWQEAGMAEHHWIAYGAILRQIHATVLPPDLAQHMEQETFTPAWSDTVKHLGDRAEALGQRLRAAAAPFASDSPEV